MSEHGGIPPPPPSAERVIKKGDVVHINGLQSRSDLNGMRADVLHWDAAAERYAVSLFASGECVKIKDENLSGVHLLNVSVVSGLSDTGKSTLAQHIVSTSRELGMRVSVLHNDSNSAEKEPAEDGCSCLPDGCICCSMREEFISHLVQFTNMGLFEHLLVDASGYSDPKRIAEALHMASCGGEFRVDTRRTRKVIFDVELDTMLSVVDATAISHYLLDESIPTSSEGERGTVAQLLLNQVTFADVIIVEKSCFLSESQVDDLKKLLSVMNAEANVLLVECSDVCVKEVLGRGARMRTREGVRHPCRKRLLANGRSAGASNASAMRSCTSACCAVPAASEAEDQSEIDLKSFTSRCVRPFHPQQLAALVEGSIKFPAEVCSVTGTCWVASRPARRGLWSTTGVLSELREGHPWWSTVPRNRWPELVVSKLMQQGFLCSDGHWSSVDHGDCHSELTIIGKDMNTDVIEKFLETLCLTDDEFAQGPAAWALYEDRLPAWSTQLDSDVLCCLASVGSEDMLKALCLQGADTNSCNSINAGTALHVAALKDRTASISVLLDSKGDCNAAAKRELTPMHLASSAAVVDLLSQHGAALEASDSNGHTPLHHAAALGKIEVAEALLARRAHVDALTHAAETPLHLAVGNSTGAAVGLVKLLCAARCNLQLVSDVDGLQALEKARQTGRDDLIAILAKQQAEC